jgi:hypothetical protein
MKKNKEKRRRKVPKLEKLSEFNWNIPYIFRFTKKKKKQINSSRPDLGPICIFTLFS